MSNQDNDQKLTDKSGIILIIVGAVLVSISLYFYLSPSENKGLAPAVAAPIEGASQHAPSAPIASNAAKESFDLKAALAPRKFGKDDAPVKIYEFASLSCGHCAQFHAKTFKDIAQKYVETGKVQFIFSDFPLNEPALQGAMLARCLPEDQYLPFTEKLFKEQDQWAYKGNHTNELIKRAESFGLSKKAAKSCLEEKGLSDGLIASLQSNARQWNINSTPSFLINNKTVISGNRSLDDFSAAIDTFLTE